MLLQVPSVIQKVGLAATSFHAALRGELVVPLEPARDAKVIGISDMPSRPGISKWEGQSRLLHDVANIELQAMELALRTLIEFPDAPEELRNELLDLGLSEARHLQMCLEGLDAMGCPWGSHPVSLMLWETVSSDDDLLDRILIVHRYLEGGGLDASARILRRMAGVQDHGIVPIISEILREEVGHVQFGSKWYRKLLGDLGQDQDQDFGRRLSKLRSRLPRRLEKLDMDLRVQAGFTTQELEVLMEFQEQRKIGV